jgi:predicted RNase H-like nuclease
MKACLHVATVCQTGSGGGSSVFPAPIRPALVAETRVRAAKINFNADGRRVGVQSFGIFPKIREIDEVLHPNPKMQSRVFEVHPELSFWAWNGGKAMEHSKKSPSGKVERRCLIDRCFGQTAVDTVRASHPAKEVGLDDIHDAFAALWLAQRISEESAKVVPNPPPLDSEGLMMTIWY